MICHTPSDATRSPLTCQHAQVESEHLLVVKSFQNSLNFMLQVLQMELVAFGAANLTPDRLPSHNVNFWRTMPLSRREANTYNPVLFTSLDMMNKRRPNLSPCHGTSHPTSRSKPQQINVHAQDERLGSTASLASGSNLHHPRCYHRASEGTKSTSWQYPISSRLIF